MVFQPPKRLTQALLASSVMVLSQAAQALPLYVTTDLTNTAAITVDSGGIAFGNKADPGTNNPLIIKAIGGSITTTGASAIVVDSTAAAGIPQIIVENSATTKSADISSDQRAIDIATTNVAFDNANLFIKLEAGAIVQATGNFPVIEERGLAENVLNLQNEGTLKNTGTGANSNVILTSANSVSTQIRNKTTGIIQAGSIAHAIDLTFHSNNPGQKIGEFINEGHILAPGGSAIVSPFVQINPIVGPNAGVVNKSTGLISGKNNVINLGAVVTDVNNAGTITATDGPLANAISTGGIINIQGGAVTGTMISAKAAGDAIQFNLGKGNSFSTNGALTATAGGIQLNTGTLVLNDNITKSTVVNVIGTTDAILRVTKNVTVNGVVSVFPPASTQFDLSSSVTGTSGFGKITLETAGSSFANTALTITNQGNGYIANNTVFQIIDSSGLGVNTTNLKFIYPTSAIYTYAGATTANTVSVTVTRKSLDGSLDQRLRRYIGGAGAALEQSGIENTTNPQILQALGELSRLPTYTHVENALKQLVPPTNQMNMALALSAPQLSLNSIANRLANLRLDEQNGYNAGDISNISPWAQVFAQAMSQDKRHTVDGYKSDTKGFALGADRLVDVDTHLGAAFAFAKTDAKSKLPTRPSSEINTYQFMVYGDKAIGCGWIEGFVSNAHMRFKGIRPIRFGAINLEAKNFHKGSQWNSRVAYAHTFKTEYDVDFIPHVSVGWAHIAEKAYFETGAGGLNLSVDSHNVELVDMSFKTKFSMLRKTSYGPLRSTLFAGLTHDAVTTREEVMAKYAVGPSFRVVGLDQTRASLDLGFDFRLLSVYGAQMSLSYDVKVKQDSARHNGYFNVRYDL